MRATTRNPISLSAAFSPEDRLPAPVPVDPVRLALFVLQPDSGLADPILRRVKRRDAHAFERFRDARMVADRLEHGVGEPLDLQLDYVLPGGVEGSHAVECCQADEDPRTR